MRPWPRVLTLAVATCALAGCGGSAESGPRTGVPGVPSPPDGAFSATVERVVDGDTFVARRDGSQLRVRLIGVDAPESVQPEAPVECFGPEAGEALRRLLPEGATVTAAHQAGEPVDRFGRQLWDVWLGDGRFVQAELVRKGAVRARDYPPHDRYAGLLAGLDDDARRDGAGLHGACS